MPALVRFALVIKVAERSAITHFDGGVLSTRRMPRIGGSDIHLVAGDRLLVSKRHVMGEHISHAVLADGGLVQAAGEFEVIEFGDVKVVTSLNNMSGHYRPGGESLDVAMEAFEERGLRVLADGVEQYDWHTP